MADPCKMTDCVSFQSYALADLDGNCPPSLERCRLCNMFQDFNLYRPHEPLSLQYLGTMEGHLEDRA